ncbi:hypothetical protein [Polyangium jinanense]|uniref:Outer membrane protein beta-barrel domain-containing protein n=1 Tax=Polyangium jinanense TaxID=2829994 RepID=A0A9X4AZZ1_9BACT|nr:hypothetical protein [Polyangium jinanense]MDC3988627.1 hypothetical protein [Polyangium jinanense]
MSAGRAKKTALAGLVAASALVSVSASAQEEELPGVEDRRYGLASVNMFLRYTQVRDPEAMHNLSSLLMGGLSARALYGKRIAYAFGLGLEFGAGGAPGFGFGFELYPAGVAVAIGPSGYFGIFGGIGVNGVTARVPMTLVLPAEVRLELDVTKRARVGALFAVGWTPADDVRQTRAGLFPFVDENTMALTARFGKTFEKYGNLMGRGYFFRLERREQMRTVSLGLVFGWELEVAN